MMALSARSLLVWVFRRENPLQGRLQVESKQVVASQQVRSPLVTTSSIWPIQADRTPLPRILPLGCKNIPLPSSALFAQSDLLEHTTYDLIFARIPTNVHLYVLYATKPLLDNMTGRGMRGCTLARRNLFAKVSWAQEVIGAVAASSLVPMLWGAIFDLKPGEYASSHCLMRKRLKEPGK